MSGSTTKLADLPIRCACGSVRGIIRGVSASAGTRVVCYCDDCQSFAHFLGGVERILDPHGGTDIFQTSPARLQITQGMDGLACMRLRPGGLLRWYAGCCRTPIGNTLATRQIPFVGLIHGPLTQAPGERPRDDLLGSVRGRIYGHFAKGDRATLNAHDRVPAPLMLRAALGIVVARLRGDHARSPFFDTRTGEPVRAPHVLTAAELSAVEAIRA